MNLMLFNKVSLKETLHKALRSWLQDKEANVVIETAFIFPILVTLVMGAVDLGKGLLINKKLISAVHITSDLIAREESLSDAELDEFVEAGRLALEPYANETYGVDVAGIRFMDEDADPEVQWRDTIDTSVNNSVEENAVGLGKENEGVVAVTARYSYQPHFSGIITGTIEMEEVAYVRGRVSSFVQRE